jgi:hypothetical protein
MTLQKRPTVNRSLDRVNLTSWVTVDRGELAWIGNKTETTQVHGGSQHY